MSVTLSRREISDAVSDIGWRYVLGLLRTSVRVTSLTRAAEVASVVVAASGRQAAGHLWLDLRQDRVVVSVQSPARSAASGRSGAESAVKRPEPGGTSSVTPPDIELARRISAVVAERGLVTDPEVDGDAPRSVQVLEIAIDALDIPAVRPFWKAVLGYADEVDRHGPGDAVVDPVGQGPAVWFQQMDAPRPQRNRIHLDISVPHDEAPRRVKAALAAGGVLVSDAAAPAFWVLADPEGNEACVTTWQGRDP